MTEPIKSACGNFYAGMKNEEIEKTNDTKMLTIFTDIDTSKNDELSEAEILAFRKFETEKMLKTGKKLKRLGKLGLFAGAIVLQAAITATSPAWVPIAGGVLLSAGLASIYAGLIKRTKADNIDDETQKYLEQKQAVEEAIQNVSVDKSKSKITR